MTFVARRISARTLFFAHIASWPPGGYMGFFGTKSISETGSRVVALDQLIGSWQPNISSEFTYAVARCRRGCCVCPLDRERNVAGSGLAQTITK